METHDIVILATILAASNALITLGDRLWRNKKQDEDKPSQSLACGFQHVSFQKSLDSQETSLKEMVHALRDMVEDAKLRHQITCDKLDRMNSSLERLENHNKH